MRYSIIERDFTEIKTKNSYGVSLNIEGNTAMVVAKRQKYGDNIMWDMYVNENLVLSNIILAPYDGLMRRRYANDLFDYDFVVIPVNYEAENSKITIESLGKVHFLAYAIFEEAYSYV